jgi:hypothetical protein
MVHEDKELSRLVERFVLRREELGFTPEWATPGEPDDMTEGGLTDFPYVDESQTASARSGTG